MNRVPAAVISTDVSLVEDLKRCGEETDALEVVLEFGVAFREMTELQMKKIRMAAPRLVFIDLDSDASTACKVARYLAEASPEMRFVAAGTAVPMENLVEAMRAGISEYLEKPLSRTAVEEAMNRLSRKLAGDARATGVDVEGQVLLFCAAKGGAGSTTVATNCAIQLRRQTGARVLLVDLDLTLGDTALYLGVEPRYGIVDLARNLHRIDEDLLSSYITHHSSGLDLLAAPFDPEEGRGIGAEEVERILGFLRGLYDYVVVDASNSVDAGTTAALRAATEIFLVTQIDVPSLRNVQRLRRVLNRVVPELLPRVVVNRFHSAGDITLRDVEKALGLEVYWTLANDYDSALHSINTGEPLVMSDTATCQRQMAELVGKISGVRPETEKRSRWAPGFRSWQRRPTLLAGAES